LSVLSGSLHTMTTHGAADHRLDELRAHRATRAAERAAFAERRRHGLRARHEAKLRRLAEADMEPDIEEVIPEEPDNSTLPEPDPESDVA
jgi:hypothetical protein